MILSALCLAAITRTFQERTYAFLSYKDTVFAIRKRSDWGEPAMSTEFPGDTIELQVLGLNFVRGPSKATPEGWDSKASCFNVACDDFDHVMGWSIEPRFPREVRRRTDKNAESLTVARKLMAARHLTVATVKSMQVFSADLDGAGQQELLVELSMRDKTLNPGLAFIYSPTLKPRELAFSRDGWPKILSVVELDHDNIMEVIVGGPTATGKTVSLWKYSRGKLAKLAQYDSSPPQ